MILKSATKVSVNCEKGKDLEGYNMCRFIL